MNIRGLTPHFEDPPTKSLVLSHWLLRFLGLGLYTCILSYIRFSLVLDSPASIREASVNTIRIYRTIKWTFYISLKIHFTPHKIIFFFAREPHWSKTHDSWLKLNSWLPTSNIIPRSVVNFTPDTLSFTNINPWCYKVIYDLTYD